MNVSQLMVDTWSTTAKEIGKLYGFVTPGDIREFRRRCHAEGMTYITVTLPKLGKALESAFISGRLELPAEFKKRKSCAYAQFLSKGFALLFDEEGQARFPVTGGFEPLAWDMRDELSSAVLCIRQLTLMFYKLEMPYPPDIEKAFIARFKATDRALEFSDKELDSVNPLLTRASQLIKRLLHRFNPMEIMPKHGSGSSSCGLEPTERYGIPRYFPQIDSVYKYTEWYYTSLEQIADLYPRLFEESDEHVPTAKVVLIPKDSRGPRLISMEPRETMYLQQGLMTMLYDAIEYYPLVRSQLSCTDQSRNRDLSRSGSETGSYATLDLEEASDRVSLKLVTRLFPRNWVECLTATRSPQVVLPDGKIFPLQKFASMGSACCFPVECICFWALTLAATLPADDNLSRLFSRKTPRHKEMFVDISVFGDDIIVPTSVADKAIRALESVGLKVNRNKSFTTGPFRESCGADFYLGRDVGITRIKSNLDVYRDWAELCHSKFRLTNYINNIVAKLHLDPYPFVELFEAYYGRIDLLESKYYGHVSGLCIFAGDVADCRSVRAHPRYLTREVKLLTERGVDREVILDSWCCLLRWHLLGARFRSLAMVPIRNRYRYKKGWVTTVCYSDQKHTKTESDSSWFG